MNGRQAARSAAQRIEELEHWIRLNTADIKGYNKVILGMIEGESPCGMCNDRDECQREEKDGKGCEDWLLKFGLADVPEENR